MERGRGAGGQGGRGAGGSGAGEQEAGGREKRGRETGFPRWREAGEKEKITQHCAIFHNQKKCKEAEVNKLTNTGREPG